MLNYMVSNEIYSVEAMLSHHALASNRWDSFAFSPMFSCIDEPPSISKYVSQRHFILYIRQCFLDKTTPTLAQLNIYLAIPCSLEVKIAIIIRMMYQFVQDEAQPFSLFHLKKGMNAMMKMKI